MTNLATIVFDIDGVIRDVSQSYRRALADTVEHFTNQAYRPTMTDIDQIKSEGKWNNDWKASEELTYRYFEQQGQTRQNLNLNYEQIVKFFQTRYRGTDPVNFNGYILSEPVLATKNYFEMLTDHNFEWGFFSGATQGSADFILKKRIGLENPVLVAMEDAPEKPDPTGLFMVMNQLNCDHKIPVIYAGDTVADLYTVNQAKEKEPDRLWIGVGILPPHVLKDQSLKENYANLLKSVGACVVLENVEMLTPMVIKELINNH